MEQRKQVKKDRKGGGNPQAWAEGWFQNTSSHRRECPTWMGVDGKASEQFSVSWDCWHACRLGLKTGRFGFGVWGKNTCLTHTPLTNGYSSPHCRGSLHLKMFYAIFLLLVFETPYSSIPPRVHQQSSMVWKAPPTPSFRCHSLPTKLVITGECG